MRRRYRRSLACVWALGLLAGCGRDEPATAPPPPPDPCGLIAPAAAAALLGAPAAPVRPYATPDGSAAGCIWQAAGGASLTLNLATGPRGRGSVRGLFDLNRKTLLDAGQGVEDVPQLGEAAWWQTGAGVLHVLVGECYVTLHLGGPAQAGARATLEPLAAELAPRACSGGAGST